MEHLTLLPFFSYKVLLPDNFEKVIGKLGTFKTKKVEVLSKKQRKKKKSALNLKPFQIAPAEFGIQVSDNLPTHLIPNFEREKMGEFALNYTSNLIGDASYWILSSKSYMKK